MVKAARRASQIINRAAQDIEHLKITTKRKSDYVTEVDKAAEATIIETLREAYPDYGILAEESGLAIGAGEGNEYQWIIDPLDGTTNFIHGLPQYSVSIALAHRGIVNQAAFVISLPDLGGEARLRGAGVEPLSLIQFPGH